ncbi:MAG: hypothetical protein ACI4DZ_14565 [Oliverpabstia sp.]
MVCVLSSGELPRVKLAKDWDKKGNTVIVIEQVHNITAEYLRKSL